MSIRDFVEKRVNAYQLDKAVKQQKQIRYLTISSVQEDVRLDFLEKLTESKYTGGDDPLLSWVYALFKKDNFKSFYKYLRFPVSSSGIVKDEVESAIRRVFYSDDSYRQYVVRGNEIQTPDYLNYDSFLEKSFNAIMYRYNDIVVHDMEDINIPCRKIVSIDKVVSIKEYDNKIKKIAYRSKMEAEYGELDGYVYLDDQLFAFVPDDKNSPIIEVPHDIGECPANFISSSPFDEHEPIVRNSIFSRTRPLLEEYVFLTTLRLMSDANGSFPIVVKLAGDEQEEQDDQREDFPLSSSGIKGHKEKKNESGLQAGSVHSIQPPPSPNGGIDTSVTQNYINFFRTPVDSLKYVDERIKSVRKTIVEKLVGDFVEQGEDSKNEMQVSKSYMLKQDKLRNFAKELGYCMNLSDTIMLKLANGTDCVVNGSYGTDFFIETQGDIFKRLQIAPNPVEKQSLIDRLVRIRSFNNSDIEKRDNILYALVPFVTDSDFEKAVTLKVVSSTDILLQTQFNYFITIFESKYGDVVSFWKDMEGVSDEKKLVFLKTLLNQIIKDYESTNSSREDD